MSGLKKRTLNMNREAFIMNTPSVRKNYIFNLLNQLVTLVSPLLITPYISRVLGAEGIGVYSYTTANMTYFTLFGMMGISGYGQRCLAMCRDDKEKASKYFWELEMMHLLIVGVTIVPFIMLVVFSFSYKIYYVIHVITILSSLIEINWVYQAFEKFQILAVRNIVIKLLTVSLVFKFVRSKDDLAVYIFINVIGIFIANLSMWCGLKKYLVFMPVKPGAAFKHFKEVIIYFIPTIAASIYSVLDKSMINWITHSEAENGYYEQAHKVEG